MEINTHIHMHGTSTHCRARAYAWRYGSTPAKQQWHGCSTEHLTTRMYLVTKTYKKWEQFHGELKLLLCKMSLKIILLKLLPLLPGDKRVTQFTFLNHSMAPEISSSLRPCLVRLSRRIGKSSSNSSNWLMERAFLSVGLAAMTCWKERN